MWTVNSSGAPPTQLTTASSCKDILCYCVFEVVVQCPGFEKRYAWSNELYDLMDQHPLHWSKS